LRALEFGEAGAPQGDLAEPEEPPRGGGDAASIRMLSEVPPAPALSQGWLRAISI